MVLIFFQWVLFCILTESYVSLQVWLMEADSSFFLTAVIFLLVGGAWEDQLSSPPVGCNNFSCAGCGLHKKVKKLSTEMWGTVFRYWSQTKIFSFGFLVR